MIIKERHTLYLKEFVVVAKDSVSHEVIAGKLLACDSNVPCLEEKSRYVTGVCKGNQHV
jgi:hypothetical protein